MTALLQAWTAGDEGARDRLIPLVYRELHALADQYMAGEQPDATLQTTGLVNELRFFGGLDVEETAAAFDVSPQTVQRDWRLAKVWLFRELSGGAPRGA